MVKGKYSVLGLFLILGYLFLVSRAGLVTGKVAY